MHITGMDSEKCRIIYDMYDILYHMTYIGGHRTGHVGKRHNTYVN
jgi:hypothetical protein